LQAQLITKEDSIGSLAKEALVMCHEPNIHNHNITRQYVQQSIVWLIINLDSCETAHHLAFTRQQLTYKGAGEYIAG